MSDQKPPLPRPQILDYMDYRQFMRDQLAYLQSTNSKYSQRWIAKRAGFNSLQLLSMIIQGQRQLAADRSEPLAKAMKLDDTETQYFCLIVDLAASTSHDEQKKLLLRIKAEFQNGIFAPISDEGVEIFREWYFPAIREIVTLEGSQTDPVWIATRLGIEPEQALEALNSLIKMEFLRYDEHGKLVRSEPSVRTATNKMYPFMLGSWHMKMLERAFSAVLKPRDRRHFEGLTLAMPQSMIPRLRQKIQVFFREVDMLVEENQEQREEIVHLHLGLFPLTNWQEKPTESKS